MAIDYADKLYTSGYGCGPSVLCGETAAWELYGRSSYIQFFCTEEQIAKVANFEEAYQKGYDKALEEGEEYPLTLEEAKIVMNSYNIAPVRKFPEYRQFCYTDEDCEQVEKGSSCKEGMGVLDEEQNNWFTNTGCGKKYNSCRFLARKEATLVNKNYDPVTSPFYAAVIKCYDNEEIDFSIISAPPSYEKLKDDMSKFDIELDDDELSTNSTNSGEVKTQTNDLTPIYIGVPAAIVLLGALIGLFFVCRPKKSN